MRSSSPPTSRPRPAAVSSADTASGSAVRAAAPTEAYWLRISSPALADQGSSSQSSTTQSDPSSAHSGSHASRSRSTNGAVSSKNGRPVRV